MHGLTQNSFFIGNDGNPTFFVSGMNADVGKVGIGTTAPDQRLSVNGNASKTGGGSWLVFSDERLKNIYGSFDAGLNEVLQLQPSIYYLIMRT